MKLMINYAKIGKESVNEQNIYTLMIFCWAIFLGALFEFWHPLGYDIKTPAFIVFIISFVYLLYKADNMPWNKKKAAVE